MRKLLIGAAALALCSATGAGAAERAKANVDCKPTQEKFVYDCMLMLTGKKNGAPIDGAKIVVNADMPSMAMAHNIRPVTAEPAGKPGLYHARIELEMHGEWALTMDVSGPTRDKLIHKMHFGKDSPQPAGHTMGHGHGSGMKKKTE